jgi:hypothetical protein
MIQKIKITPNGGEWKEIVYGSGAIKYGTATITVNSWEPVGLTVDLIDIYGFKYTQSATILDVPTESWWIETEPPSDTWPKITMINPKNNNLNLYTWDPFNLRFQVDISTTTREIQVFLNNSVHHTATNGKFFLLPMSSAWLPEWKHTVRITAIDGNFQTTEKIFTLTILPR